MSRRTRKKQPLTGVRTARTTRQNIVAGTVAEIAALAPLNTSSKGGRAAPEEVITPIPDHTVEAAIAFIKRTEIAEYVDTQYAASKKKPGRPALLATFAVLVAMQLAIRDDKPLLLTQFRTILYRRISPTMRRLLNVPEDRRPTTTNEARARDERTAAVVRRAFHRLLAPIDPSTLPKNRIRTWDEIEALKRSLTPQEQEERAVALDWVCNQLLESAYLQLPDNVRERQRANDPGYCIDASPIPLFARGKGVDNVVASADPDGGFYVREGDHRDPNDTNPFTRTTSKYVWARDAHALIAADATHPTRRYFPAIPIAITTGIPGVDPAGAARRLFADMAGRGHTPGSLAGDILYTNQHQGSFQTPAREAGYDLVLGYGINQTGVQGTHPTGALLLDGWYVAPCIPDDLKDLTNRLRTKEITHAEYKAPIQARVAYKMRTKENADPARGVKERVGCPASGPNPTAMCALKPKSLESRPTRQADGVVLDLRRRIDHTNVLTNGQAPRVCGQDTITISATDGAKFRQPLQFGTDEHTSLYHRLRQSQEGIHGSAKDGGTVALDIPARRRVRGWAAQQLFVAFMLAETATRRIFTFLTNAIHDRHGDLYVKRDIVVTDDADLSRITTGNPPGAAPPQAA